MNKEQEIAEFRKANSFYTTETIRQIELERELMRDAAYRRRLYDWCMNDRIGKKPLR